MRNNNPEQASKIKTREIPSSDEGLIEAAASLVSEFSWGKDYPVKPIDEIRAAEYRIGTFDDDRLVGFGTVGRSFSLDGLDDRELWIAHDVVDPEFRNRGIFKEIYEQQLSYAIGRSGRVLSCTDNPIVAKFFLKNGWKKIRETADEAGGASVVFEYDRCGSGASTKISPAKQKLFELEKAGKYLFHGSGSEIEEFEPRQAHDFIDGKNIPDGPPAVFASSAAEYAIFMAIINRKNCPKGYHSSAGTHSGQKDGRALLRFRAAPGTLEQLKDDASGWVYYFGKALFEKRNKGGVEYVSLKGVRPIGMVKVSKADLPQYIQPLIETH